MTRSAARRPKKDVVTIRLNRFDAGCLPYLVREKLADIDRFQRVHFEQYPDQCRMMVDLRVQMEACLVAVTEALQVR